MVTARTLIALTITLAAALSLVLANPPRASACTGCPTKFGEFVKYNDRVVLARYIGRSGGQYAFRLIDVLKGRSPRTLRIKYEAPGTPPPPPIGSRWLLSTFVAPDGLLGANNAFQVHPDGSVTPTDEGEGSVEAPDTLSGWYRAIAQLPDTATPPSAREPGTSHEPVGTLVAVAVLGAIVLLRRLATGVSPRRARCR